MTAMTMTMTLTTLAANSSNSQQQQQILMQLPDQMLFTDSSFHGMFPDVDQELSFGGMDFSEWVNFAPPPGAGAGAVQNTGVPEA